MYDTVCDLTTEQWDEILKNFDYKCAYCGKKLDNPQREHFIPVSKGGGYTISNIVPSCVSCNSSKKNNHPLDWLVKKEHGILLFSKLSDYLKNFL